MAEVKAKAENMKEPLHTTSTSAESQPEVESASASGSGSGSENGEKPVREKLKQTDLEEEEIGENENSTTEINGAAVGEGAGKLKKKRSYEDLLHEKGTDVDTLSDSEHTRKKTREASTPTTKEAKNTRQTPEAIVEDNEDATHSDVGEGEKIVTPPSSNEAMEDADDSAKIRKKRSAEEMSDPPNPPKSPKVAATNAERERRSSSTPSDKDSRSADSECQDTTGPNPPRSVPQVEQSGSKKSTKLASPTTSGFANTSTTSPFASLSPTKIKEPAVGNQPQTSASAFAASGFAALASSSSPFGAIAKEKSSDTEDKLKTSPSAFAASGFGALSGSTSPFGTATEKSQPAATKKDASPFASATTQTGFGFGAKPFGSGFGSAFAGGQKLSSFAAPVGDAKLGSAPAVKPFGAPAVSDDEDEGSSDENADGDEDAGATFGEPKTESVSQFKVQDDITTGEEEESTSFLANAKLFQFTKGTGWAERGTGPFKLNYKIVEASDAADKDFKVPSSFVDLEPGQAEVNARFIMRNAATHKVIISAGIFKGMKVGDREGKEPEKKNEIFFSAASSTGLTLYLLRMGKKDDSKELYDQVAKIQQLL